MMASIAATLLHDPLIWKDLSVGAPFQGRLGLKIHHLAAVMRADRSCNLSNAVPFRIVVRKPR